MYRATAMGPGVTPIVEWQGGPPGDYRTGGFPSRFPYSFPSTPDNSFARAGYEANAESAQKLGDEDRAMAGQAPGQQERHLPIINGRALTRSQ